MDGFLSDPGGWIKEQLTNFLDYIVDWLVDVLFAPLLESFLNTGTSIYNAMLNGALDIMTKSPDQWNTGGWDFIAGEVNIIFVAFGSSLVAIFFLIGMCSESIDIKNEIRLESIITSLLKLCVAEFFVINSLNIVTTMFGFITDLTTFTKDDTGKTIDFSISVDVTKADLKGLSWGPTILTVLLAFVCMIALIASGAIITYTAYMRFFKILLLVPYGAIASSTLAGNHMLSNSAVAFWKYAISTVFEGITMILALSLFSRIEESGGLSFVDASALSGELALAGELIDKTLLALLCLGVIKGAGALTQKVLGL